eukprot:TRINITY_DN2773_c0_g1_i2.p1 TRINITY_DN2773_c0_g1~~TRINITY_DN2773_c0_g1_i2.p1  ORF type:complete len:772 (+),score=61.10 TRINITY_DN2773_c0_g1_i2:2474-4789(+)
MHISWIKTPLPVGCRLALTRRFARFAVLPWSQTLVSDANIMSEPVSFADVPVDVLRFILERQSVVLSGRLSLVNRFWRTQVWRCVVTTVAVWPTIDTVVKCRDADLMLSTIRAHGLSTSVRHMRIYVNNGRRLDSRYMSMSPLACSELLVSSKETLRHLALAFAPQPSLIGLSRDALEMASSLFTLELVISEFTRDWCISFLSQCSNVERLALTFLRSDIPAISAEFLALSCPKLQDLSILCPGDAWMRFSSLKSLSKFTIRYVTDNILSHNGWWDVQGVPPAVSACLRSNDALRAITTLSSWMPESVGMNWAVQVTYANVQVYGKSPTLVFSPLLILALAEHTNSKSIISTLKYLIEHSKTGKLTTMANVFVDIPQCTGSIPLETMILHPILRDLLQQPRALVGSRVSQLLLPVLDFLSKAAEIDFTRPLVLQSYLDVWFKIENCTYWNALNLPWTVTEFGEVSVDDSANLFFVSCQYDVLIEVVQHLLTSGLLQQLKSSGKAKRALLGPGRKTLLMAAAESSPKTLQLLCDNLDLLIDEPQIQKRAQATLNFINARDIAGQSLLHHIANASLGRRRHIARVAGDPPPQYDLKQLISAGADPFLWSPDLMSVPPPINFVGHRVSLLESIPANATLSIPGIVQCLVMLMRSKTSLSAIEATLDAVKHLWKDIAEYRNPQNGLTLFHICCHCGERYAAAIENLLGDFIDVNAPSPLGTPLFFARLANPKTRSYALSYRDEPDGMGENLQAIRVDGLWVTADILDAVVKPRPE